MVFMVALGLLGLTASPAGAQSGEFCAPQGDWFLLNLFDPTKDGVISIGDLQFIADGLPDGEQKTTFQNLVNRAEDAEVTGIRYNAQGACAPATSVPATTVPGATATNVPATTAPGTATNVPTTTVPSTTAPGTTVATTAPGTTVATSAPGTTATAVSTDPATTAPDDDGDDDGGEGDGESTVVTLPDTGQGPDAGQGNATFVMLLGGMSLLVAAAFFVTKRREA